MKPANRPSLFTSFLFTLAIITILLSCNEHGTDPNKPPKNPFEMTWTADTIAYEGSSQTLMTSMWASSPTDVWIAGHTDLSRGNIYHYDGIKWNKIDPMEKDIPGSVNTPNKVMGLTANNIWIVGDRRVYTRKDMIINWNGIKWKEHNLNLQLRPISLYVNRADDVWVGCDSAVVLHYNGVTWERDIPKLNIPRGSEYFVNGLVVKDNNLFINVNVYDIIGHRYLHYFLKGGMKNWTILDSMEVKNPLSMIKWGNRGLSLGNKGNIYSFGDWGVWTYSSNIWQRIIPINYTMLSIYELSENYKISVGVYGMVWFYDGASWEQITKFFTQSGEITLTDVWTDGQEVFLLGHTTSTWPQKTIIWRGK